MSRYDSLGCIHIQPEETPQEDKSRTVPVEMLEWSMALPWTFPPQQYDCTEWETMPAWGQKEVCTLLACEQLDLSS
jgi:hypothetical protein